MTQPPISGQPDNFDIHRLTLQEIIAQFRNLGLLITDDQAIIDTAAAKVINLYRHEMQSPDPDTSDRSRSALKAIVTIRNPAQRKQLLEIVYEGFKQLAPMVVEIAINQQLEVDDVKNLLEATAANMHLDSSLARQFAGRFISEMTVFENSQSPQKDVMPDEVEFSAFYPRNVEAEIGAGLFVYAHLDAVFELIERDIVRFRAELGGEIPRPKIATKKVKVKPGTMVTIMPECDDLEFNPQMLVKRWEPDWVRFEFDFKASNKLVGETLIVNISIQVEGIEIASIKTCAVEVFEKKAENLLEGSAMVSPENRLAKAKAQFNARMANQTATLYQKIFVSYSRKDTTIVRAYKAAQEAVGNDVFVDTEGIHTGEDWMARLAMEIDKADVLQLFWSENSASSEFVREEWEYALLHKCPEEKCIGFIRPVYWKSEKPNPDPPKELSHLHFRCVDFG